MKKTLFVAMLSAMLFCCSDPKVSKVSRAFYFWQNESGIDNNSKKALNALDAKKVYVKYFEVDFNDAMGNFPFAKKSLSEYEFNDIENLEIIPTVYIKNEIFKFNSEKDLDVLADNIVFLVDKYSAALSDNVTANKEIQIDCDWTASTKDKYFYLLKKIKQLSKREISCTLRLYPYKYPDKMGVPPVDKAMLMCYNLIRPLSQKDKNSILDYTELKSYLDKKRKYPKHLDIALPLFFWSHLYQDNHFSTVVSLNANELKEFTKPLRPMWYEVTKDTTIGYSTYLRIGDKIKCEEVSKVTLDKTISLLKKNAGLDSEITVSFFHLDDNVLKQFTNEEISGFYDSFTK